ncbi:MAG: hypothetical protein Q9208_000739 [Pyrenodesmia sp. 3 TL-2023]
MQDHNDLSSSSCADLRDYTSSSYFASSSISSFHERYPATSRSYRPRFEANAKQSISDLKSLLDILFTNRVPGPKLIRLEREFCASIGHGGQGNVWGVSPDFEKKASALQNHTDSERVKYSAQYWTKCVVKHLRTDQQRNDVQHAFREISRLCTPSLRSHPNIVKLVSWGISLDALEAVNLESLCTPLLILEKAHCDLAQFIKSEEFAAVPYETLCDLSMAIGRGLGAVHSAGIVHGDLKLENILIFLGHDVARKKWTAKLCDFGSAVPISGNANAPDSATYLGSKTWLPPEWYEKSLYGHPLPSSLVPCDIFVYGLVVWALFIGIHFSPLYKIQTVDDQGQDIARHIGEQRFYARARDSVTASFSPAYSDVLQLLAAFTEQTFSHFGGGAERQAVERRHQRRQLARSSTSARVLSDGIQEDDEVRRILSVLRASLNDSPGRRDLQPWRYLDYKRYPSVPRVDNPPQYKPKYSKDIAREENSTGANRSTNLRSVILNTLLRPVTYSLETTFFSRSIETTWATIKQVSTQLARGCISSTIQILNQRHRRQKIYEECVKYTVKGNPGFKDINSLGILEHPPGGKHHLFDSFLAETRPCYLKWCCWQEYSVNEESVVQQYLRNQPEVDISALAWLCRGEVGQREVQRLNESRSPIWGFGAYTDPMKTNIFLLLFERGFEIHSPVAVDWGERTQFMWFLKSLKQPEYALDVAAHFQRIAREDTTSLREKYFLTGRTADVDTEEDHEALLNSHTTTALHDAVGATNYPLVEYLVRNAFNVSASDSTRRTALECMIDLPVLRSTSDVNSIRALLEQNQSRRRGGKPIGGLPLGWEETLCNDGRWRDDHDRTSYGGGLRRGISFDKSLRAWQETSIEGEFDAISFIAPKTGLYESDRLTLGRVRGEKQIYRLDPLRFLKRASDGEVTRKPASKPVFDEEWYRADIRAIETPLPFRPLHDARAWIRYPARGLQFAWKRGTLVFMVFTLLSLVARFKSWAQLELIFGVVAVSLFAFGFSTAGVWIGTARIIPKSSYGSNLWSNAPEFFLGLSAVARGKTTLAKSTLIGFILCNALWVLGISVFRVGIRHREFWVNDIRSTMNGLCLLASSLVSILVCFDITVGDKEVVPPSLDKTIFLSRSIAIVSLLLWAGFLAFRNHTHAHLFDDEADPTPLSDSGSRISSGSASLSFVENLIQAFIRLVLLGLCADNIVHSLLFQPTLTQSICIYFVIPLTTRLWAQYRGVLSTLDDLDAEIFDSSTGAALNTLLFVAPCLVLLGGIIGSPMNLRYSIMEITLVDVAVWTLGQDAWSRPRLNYFIGSLSMGLYVMCALGLYLTL